MFVTASSVVSCAWKVLSKYFVLSIILRILGFWIWNSGTLERVFWFQTAISQRPKDMFVLEGDMWKDSSVHCGIGHLRDQESLVLRRFFSNLIFSWPHITIRGSITVPPTVVTLTTCGHWTLETWLAWVRMCCKRKLQTRFQRLSKKEKNVR